MPARFFAHFEFQPAVAQRPQAAWQPAADVYRCQHGWLVKVDLAGVRAEDVHVEARRGGVSISGTRRDLRLFETQEAHLMEIAYNRFERVIVLPDDVQSALVRTEYRDGMLYIHVSPTQ